MSRESRPSSLAFILDPHLVDVLRNQIEQDGRTAGQRGNGMAELTLCLPEKQ